MNDDEEEDESRHGCGSTGEASGGTDEEEFERERESGTTGRQKEGEQ
jgi:hypothetical protein